MGSPGERELNGQSRRKRVGQALSSPVEVTNSEIPSRGLCVYVCVLVGLCVCFRNELPPKGG